MSHVRLTASAALLIAMICAAGAPAPLAAPPREILVVDLRYDPFGPRAGGPHLFEEGPGAGLFAFTTEGFPAWQGDFRGGLVASYDSTLPSTRAGAPLHGVYTQDDDFVFGAVLEVRSDGFFADPFGFHPVTFALVNSLTTGFDRTGDLSDFRADTFDNLEFSWFPQVSPLFGGPFLSPAMFGSPSGDDAFLNFSFGNTALDLPRDGAVLVTLEHVAADREMTVTVWRLGRGGEVAPVPGGRVVVDLSGLTGFAVDTLAVTAYEDGFNIFSSTGRSLRADVVYHRLFFAEGRPGRAGLLRSLLARGAGRSHQAVAGAGAEGGSRGRRQTIREGETGGR